MRNAPPVCTARWSDKDWEAWIGEPKKPAPVLTALGEPWGITEETDTQGNPLYRKLETETDEFGGIQFLMHLK